MDQKQLIDLVLSQMDTLPSADIVAITATTLSNGTLAGILSCCSKSAIKLIIGPSTPVSPVLFRLGFDYAAGVVVNDINMVRKGIEDGCSFKQIQGVRHVLLSSGKLKKV